MLENELLDLLKEKHPNIADTEIAKDKKNNTLLIVKTFSAYFIFSENMQVGTPIILFNYHPETSNLSISDIQSHGYINLGYGALLMEALLRDAKNKGVRRVSGELSECDIDHFDRLERFYSKLGFTVCFNEEKTRGKIELLL